MFLCPVGRADYVEDNYANLDTRIVEGFDFGVYYDLATGIGDWTFTWQGSVYTRYDQEPGNAAQLLLDAQNAGTLPANYPVRGFDDLLRRDVIMDLMCNGFVDKKRLGTRHGIEFDEYFDRLELLGQLGLA